MLTIQILKTETANLNLKWHTSP